MLTPERLLRLFIEVIFILLGALVVWLGAPGRLFFDRREPRWIIISAAILSWGLFALFRRGKWWERWETWTRGLSLTLLGAVMLAISRVPFLWVGPLLRFAGVLLMLRGAVGSALLFRSR